MTEPGAGAGGHRRRAVRQDDPLELSAAELRRKATELGVEGAREMDKDELVDAVAEVLRGGAAPGSRGAPDRGHG